MRGRLLQLVDAGAEGLDPVVVSAARLLRQPREASMG
jgi:formate dehydrogenase subunit delta